MLRYFNAWCLYPLAERLQRRQIRAKAFVLRDELARPFAERRARAQAQLATAVARAGQEVPYYRDLFRAIGFQPQKLARDAGYLADLPYLTKEDLREQGDRLISDKFPRGELHLRKTGGSTGPSALVYYSHEALDWTAAINLVSLEWAGKRPHRIELHLASRFPEQFPWRDRLRERVKCLALNRVNVFTDHFDPAGLEQIWREIRAARPDLVRGHPSTLYALANHVRTQPRLARPPFRIFESTGEVLDAKKRAAIEATFGCRSIDRFGNAEFGVVAGERLEASDGRLQLFDNIVWPESCPHDSGHTELVLTALRNPAMPLLRYRTGDLAELEQTDEGWFLKDIVGRVHDMVRIGPHRYPTHYLQDLLDRIGGIDEFQVEQRGGASLLRLVVPNLEHRQHVSRRLDAWWGDAIELEFTDFDGLARQGWRSKFRYLVDAATSG